MKRFSRVDHSSFVLGHSFVIRISTFVLFIGNLCRLK